MAQAEDRRRFFRINDEVEIYYRKISEAETSRASFVIEEVLTNDALPQLLGAADKKMRSLYKRIEVTHPDLAEYLKLLNYKTEILAESFLQQQSVSRKNNSSHVNLSAAGLAFGCDQAFNSGEFLEMRILLPACRALLTTCSKVVRCQEAGSEDVEYRFLVSVDYVQMKEEDRELLIKYVTKRQLAQLREEKS